MLLVLATTLERDRLYDELVSQPGMCCVAVVVLDGLGCIQSLAYAEVRLQDTGQEHMTLKWQNGVISNYEYLMYINRLEQTCVSVAFC